VPESTKRETRSPAPAGSAARDKHPLATIDQLLHSPARPMIVTHLYMVDAADAVFLQHMTELTWGTLSSHLLKAGRSAYSTIGSRAPRRGSPASRLP